jgi:integrase
VGRKPKPWFDAERKEWFTRIDGQKHRLGADKKIAERRFHELMLKPKEEAKPRSELLACEVADRFLGWVRKNRAPRTADWYTMHLQAFFTALADGSKLTVSQVKPIHVYDWVNAHPGWSSSFSRGAMVAVQRAFRWGVEAGITDQNPLSILRKPMATTRESPVTPEMHAKMLAAIKGDAFRDVIEFAWETGARPHEIKTVEARHLDPSGRKLILPPKEAKGKKRTRVIYLTASST